MGSGYSTTTDLWHITTTEYAARAKVQVAGPSLLHDTNWQQSMVGDAFDVEHCINMGFYPRLKLSASMARYQEYLRLPEIENNDLTIVSDCMADATMYPQGNESGVIQLRFDNPDGNEFYSNNVMARGRINSLKPGEVTKYTVVIWLEGNDPDCIDWLIGGMMKVEMEMRVVH